jgi:NDP-sugar pyrophosphorylase family protein
MKKLLLVLVLSMLFPIVSFAQVDREETRSVLVHFRVGTSTLDENYMDNKATLTEFANIVKTYYSDSTAHFRQIRVVASVSPEGGKAVNDRLVKQRAEAITKWISHEISANLDYAVDQTGIDWDLLIKLVEKANYEGLTGLCRDILMPNLNELKVYGFEVTGYARVIDSMKSYVEANMALLEDEVRKDVFAPERPILTKNRDDMPTRYGITSKVTNSLVADGCIINGTVKNCIIFRGVNVEEGSVVEDSILMQDTKIGKNCVIKNIITDKRVTIYDDSTVKGEAEKYKFLEKESSHY